MILVPNEYSPNVTGYCNCEPGYGYNTEENRCEKLDCSDRSYINQDNECQPCDNSCRECDGGTSDDCTLCRVGYTFVAKNFSSSYVGAISGICECNNELDNGDCENNDCQAGFYIVDDAL